MNKLMMVISLLVTLGLQSLFAVAAQPSELVVIEHVNIVPMDSDRVIKDQTLIVSGEEILDFGPSDSIAILEDATVIDGDNGFLMPGLADMHTHLDKFSTDPKHLLQYLFYGVTTVRELSGSKQTLAWREQQKNHQLDAPNIYSLGPIIVGSPFPLLNYVEGVATLLLGFGVLLILWSCKKLFKLNYPLPKWRWSITSIALVALLVHWVQPVSKNTLVQFELLRTKAKVNSYVPETLEDIDNELQRQKAAGFDGVKVYEFLPPALWEHAVKRAKQLNMYVITHILDNYPLDRYITSGVDELAHIDELVDYFFTGINNDVNSRLDIRDLSPKNIDYSKVDKVINKFKDSDIMVITTLVTDETIQKLLEDPSRLNNPEYNHLDPELKKTWLKTGRLVNWAGQQTFRKEAWEPLLADLLQAFYKAGVPLLAGSDVSVEGLVPGFHTQRDIEIMVEKGIPNYEALAAATRNAGQAVNKMNGDGEWGVIKPGYRADLLLLEQNPLENIDALQHRRGVMVRGQWYSQASLEQQLAQAK